MNYSLILSQFYKNKQWSIGEEYESLEWFSELPKPSKAELEAKYDEAKLAHKNAIAKQNREQAYKLESDPIFFLWQRGEATEQEWKNKIAEIKLRYPYEF